MKSFILFLLVFISIKNFSQDIPKGTIQIHKDEIKWIDAPPPLPIGSKIAVLEGNPKDDEIFTMRVMLPAYYKVPAHWHPKDERVTVIDGAVYVGFSEKLDTTSAAKFIAGDYYVNPMGSHHYVFTQSEGCVIQITGIGPWGLNYIEEKK